MIETAQKIRTVYFSARRHQGIAAQKKRETTALLVGMLPFVGLFVVQVWINRNPLLDVFFAVPPCIAALLGGLRPGLVIFCIECLAYLVDGGHSLMTTKMPFLELLKGLGFLIPTIFVSLLYQKLDSMSNMASHDPLTGLLNRKALETAGEQAFHVSWLNSKPLTVIQYDCDGFKEVNDKYGHQAGDQVLILLSVTIKKYVGENGLVFRTGGDEFLVLMEGLEPDEVGLLDHLIKSEFRKTAWEQGFEVGLSSGCAQRKPTTVSIDHLVNEADRLMYQQKKWTKGIAAVNPAASIRSHHP